MGLRSCVFGDIRFPLDTNYKFKLKHYYVFFSVTVVVVW